MRVWIGVCLAVLLALAGAFASYDSESTLQAAYRDPFDVQEQDRRFLGVGEALPASVRSVGYLTDSSPGSDVLLTMFDAAQYALAPLIIEQRMDRDWVIGNFTAPMDYTAAGREHRLAVVRDFGGGVVLYRRERL